MLFSRESFFMLSEGRSIKIDSDEFIKMISDKCSDWLFNKDFELYRGISKYEDNYLMIDPSNHYRESTTGLDLYNAVIDHYDDWKEFPKRSKSLICSQNQSDVLIFGDPFIVIPFNDAKFGVCKGSDIWNSFKNITNAQAFSEIFCKNVALTMHQIDDSISVNDQMFKMSDYNELIKVSDFIDKNYEDFIAHFIILNDKTIKGSNTKICEKITKLLATKKLVDILQEDIFIKEGFRLSTYKKLDLDPIDSNEIWTESKCLLVNVKETEKDSEFRKLWLKKYAR